VRKLICVMLGAVTAGSAAAVIGVATSAADPTNNTLNVVGEPYARAVAILRAQGVPATFGGSVGSDLPQAQCVVSSQKVLSGAKMQLMLNCTAEDEPDEPASTGSTATSGTGTSGSQTAESGGRPTPGAPGVVTVIATPVG
jgi:hypothetical protein